MNAPNALSPPEIGAEDLTLTRGGRLLFEGLDLRASAGSALFIRGPNGAGKSSLLLSLAGIVRPDRGRVTYRERGEDWPVGEHIHFLGHLNGIKPRLSLGENLDFFRALHGRPALGLDAALTRVGLGGLGGIEAGHLSAGQTRRLALARLLVSHRPAWLLDEPTAALDTEGAGLVAALIAEHCRNGGIVIAATHDPIEPPGLTPQTLTLGAPR